MSWCRKSGTSVFVDSVRLVKPPPTPSTDRFAPTVFDFVRWAVSSCSRTSGRRVSVSWRAKPFDAEAWTLAHCREAAMSR